MTPNDFYDRYGQYVRQAQNRPGNYSFFPYIHPQANPPNNIARLENRIIHGNLTGNKFKCCGYDYYISNMLFSISAVFYQDDFITYYPIATSRAAISFQFAGCHMAKFSIKGQYYICHIYCSSGNQGDCKPVWNDFIDHNYTTINDLVLFDPAEGHQNRWSSSFQNINATLCGLITPRNECYSFIMNTNAYQVISPNHIWQITPQKSPYIK